MDESRLLFLKVDTDNRIRVVNFKKERKNIKKYFFNTTLKSGGVDIDEIADFILKEHSLKIADPEERDEFKRSLVF